MNTDFLLLKLINGIKYSKNKVITDDFIDFISKILIYEPELRVKPLKLLLHPFFDELRLQNTLLPNGKPLPNDLFCFSPEEYKLDSESVEKLIPSWYKK